HINLSALHAFPTRRSSDLNYDDNYYANPLQGIPKYGYTQLIQNILNHPSITIQLNTKYSREWNQHYSYVFYSGPLDGYFNYQERSEEHTSELQSRENLVCR